MVGDNIKALRTLHDETIEELAKQIGVSPGIICQWEK